MPILGLLGTLIVAGIFWYVRNRGAVGTVEDVVELAGEARRAPRRMRFKRQANIHPVQQCEHPDELVAAYAAAFMEMDGLPSRDAQQASVASLSRLYNTTLQDAEELQAYGRWLMAECGTPEQAIARLGKRLYKLDGSGSFNNLMSVVSDITTASGGLSARQKEALGQIQSDFRIQ
ncbi:hypothetical protein SAMN04488030_1543 [Aliiroseovarius halocynthiae]|uniref:Co-chaperone DjlA N-terminal domain-containing protein n=1 Tax=Aliiroseovarius halocynthiae TaxID=985055 RepID=A0A545SWR4_9RHOB|nr:hypothetical protein [Aliiroseovarius halocynthiae]TQV69407.1 hypothetical protein FIL88_07630 [Aliiroseovarius halocynthiae]SMR72799.1 hypothetical protein SAMN04488030_1543 [Aliiroseovarius halocynthiae]